MLKFYNFNIYDKLFVKKTFIVSYDFKIHAPVDPGPPLLAVPTHKTMVFPFHLTK